MITLKVQETESIPLKIESDNALKPMPDEYCVGGSLAAKTLQKYHFEKGLSGITLADSMFKDCINLTEIENMPGVEQIPSRFAMGCENLEAIQLQDGLKTIAGEAFRTCRKLVLHTLPETVTNIGQYAFSNCNTIDMEALPAGLKTLAGASFIGCTNLRITEIPVGITQLGQNTFLNCTGLTSLKCLGDITSIGSGCFSSCSNMLKFDFTNNTAVPTLANRNAFPSHSGYKIVVPDALYDEWIAADEWWFWARWIIPKSEDV